MYILQAVGKLQYPVNDFPDTLRNTLVSGIERLVSLNPNIEMRGEQPVGHVEVLDQPKKGRKRSARYLQLRQEKSDLWKKTYKATNAERKASRAMQIESESTEGP